MAGLVSCDLRRALPNRKSVYMLSSTANMVIVPPAFFQEEIKLLPSIKRTFLIIQTKQTSNTASQSSMAASTSKPSILKKTIHTVRKFYYSFILLCYINILLFNTILMMIFDDWCLNVSEFIFFTKHSCRSERCHAIVPKKKK